MRPLRPLWHTGPTRRERSRLNRLELERPTKQTLAGRAEPAHCMRGLHRIARWRRSGEAARARPADPRRRSWHDEMSAPVVTSGCVGGIDDRCARHNVARGLVAPDKVAAPAFAGRCSSGVTGVTFRQSYLTRCFDPESAN